jgi:hypothetical protein
MAVIIGFAIFGLIVAVAAVLVVREAGRIARRPPPALFDPDDAFEWVVDQLPDDVAATLTADDVRRILDLQREYLDRKGAAPDGTNGDRRGPLVVGGAEEARYIVERSSATGEAYIPEQVHAVVEAQLGYLRAIGAVGPPARPDASGSAPRP